MTFRSSVSASTNELRRPHRADGVVAVASVLLPAATAASVSAGMPHHDQDPAFWALQPPKRARHDGRCALRSLRCLNTTPHECRGASSLLPWRPRSPVGQIGAWPASSRGASHWRARGTAGGPVPARSTDGLCIRPSGPHRSSHQWLSHPKITSTTCRLCAMTRTRLLQRSVLSGCAKPRWM